MPPRIFVFGKNCIFFVHKTVNIAVYTLNTHITYVKTNRDILQEINLGNIPIRVSYV